MKKLWSAFGLLLCISVHAQDYPSFERRSLIRETDTLLYRIQYPLNYSAHKKYPLVILLHGAGERGNDNNAQLFWGANVFADSGNRARYPAIVVFPQCPKQDFWARLNRQNQPAGYAAPVFHFDTNPQPGKALGLVMVLLDSLINSGHVQTKKIYIGGLSMGGMGTFELLWRRPDVFAAAFPICGGGEPGTVKAYASRTAVWVFHGDSDPVVPPINSRIMVEALQKAGGQVRYSEYPGVSHDSWKNAFQEPDFLPWIFRQKKRK